MGLVVLAALVVLAVTVFLQTSPQGADRARVLAYNAAALALSVPAALGVGLWLYGDAVALQGEKGMAGFLAVMGGGAVQLTVVALGGLIRNFVVFPRSRRARAPGAGPG